MAEEAQALSLSRVFGSSSALNALVNLSDGVRNAVCFVAGHTAVVYDATVNKQTFLQGHTAAISCIAATADKGLVVTADVGPEPLLVLWNSRTGLPVHSVTAPHRYGVAALAISQDGKQLATVSAPASSNNEQEVALWSLDGLVDRTATTPLATTAVPVGDVQTSVCFNCNNTQELISNGRRRVYFWGSQLPANNLKYYSPPLRAKDFKQSIGDFVTSVFVPESTQALTGTVDGDVVVWDEQGISTQLGTRSTDRRAVKLIRLHSAPITCLLTSGSFVVSAGEDGCVRFYDSVMRIQAWFEDFNAGSVQAVSFSSAPAAKPSGDESILNRFAAPDFVVSTSSGQMLTVRAANFNDFTSGGPSWSSVLPAMITHIADLTTHPSKPEFAVLGVNGELQRWDIHSHTMVASREFAKLVGSCLCCAKDGSFLVLGFGNGAVTLVNWSTLEDVYTSRNTNAPVLRAAASATGRHVAVADARHQVLLYAYVPHKHYFRWEYVGRMRAHHDSVVGLVFGESPGGKTRLFSLGSDCRLVEYDLEASSAAAGIRTVATQDLAAMGSGAVPTALAFAPPRRYYDAISSETLLLCTDSGYKVRVLSPDQETTSAVVLGPRFGQPVQRLRSFRWAYTDIYCLAYTTGNQVAGLMAWPMDGNPSRSMGLIAHPGGIKQIAVSHDGRKLITAGNDGVVGVWDINAGALDSSEGRPDPAWVSATSDPEFVQEMRDYFYYAQIRTQGEDASVPRDAPGHVPLEMLADLMRAAGFYPSQAEIDILLNHARFNHGLMHKDAATPVTITFHDFLSLCVNHRPVAAVSTADITAAFKAISSSGKLSSHQLTDLLQEMGEAMREEELAAVLTALTGVQELTDLFPTALDAAAFSGEVLGFEE